MQYLVKSYENIYSDMKILTMWLHCGILFLLKECWIMRPCDTKFWIISSICGIIVVKLQLWCECAKKILFCATIYHYSQRFFLKWSKFCILNGNPFIILFWNVCKCGKSEKFLKNWILENLIWFWNLWPAMYMIGRFKSKGRVQFKNIFYSRIPWHYTKYLELKNREKLELLFLHLPRYFLFSNC